MSQSLAHILLLGLLLSLFSLPLMALEQVPDYAPPILKGPLEELPPWVEESWEGDLLLIQAEVETSPALAHYPQYFKGAYAFNQRDYQAAITYFENALIESPDHPHVLLSLARCYNYLGLYEKAVEVCMQNVGKNPDYVPAYIYLGENLEAQGKVRSAIDYYEQSLEKNPSFVPALKSLADVYYRQLNDLNKAADYYRRLLEIRPSDVLAMIVVGTADALEGKVDEGIQLYERALRYRPQLIESFNRLARLLYFSGKQDDALKVMRKAVILNPGHEEVEKTFRWLYQRTSGSQELLKAASALSREFPTLPSMQKFYIRQLVHFQDYDEATSQLLRLQQLTPEDPWSPLQMGKLYLEKGMLAEAEQQFEQALERSPGDGTLSVEIARALLEHRFYDKALHYFRRALELAPQEPEVYLQLFKAYYQLQDFSQAEQALKSLTARFSDKALFHSLLAQFYLEQRKWNAALASFREALRLDPEDSGYYHQILLLLLRLNKEKEIPDLITQGEEIFKTKEPEQRIRFYLFLSSAYERWGNLDQAISLLQQALSFAPLNLEVRETLADLHNRQGDFELALQILQQIVDKIDFAKQGAPYYLALGNTYFSQYRMQLALEQYEKALALDDKNAQVLSMVVHTLNKLHRFPEANQHLKTLEKLLGEEDPAFLNLKVRSLSDQKNFEEGLSYAQTLVSKKPNDPDTLLLLAHMYYDLKDYDKAEQVLRRIMETEPDDYDAHNTLGYMFAERGTRLDEAEQLIRKALERYPGAGYILDSLAWVFFQRGDYEQALELLLKAKKLSNEDPVLYEHLGDVYDRLQQPERAREHWERALQLDPFSPSLQRKTKTPPPSEQQNARTPRFLNLLKGMMPF